MKIKYILSVLAIVACTQHSFAQYAQDGIRFSNTPTGSTSRIKALGNAGTAVGGDLSNITGNPAGLGFFTRSELSITPEFNNVDTKSFFNGANTSDTKNQLNLNNASILFYSQLNKGRNEDKNKGWLSINFGVNYARTKNYYDNSYSAGRNGTNGSSIADHFAERALNYNYPNGNGQFVLDQGSLELGALNQGLIRQVGVSQDNSYAIYFPNTQTNPSQLYTTNRTGGQADYGFALGANYSNKLYLGFGINFADLRYNNTSVLTESGTFTPQSSFNGQSYTSTYRFDQSTRGTGFNARLGLIYKPVEQIRLGATITTPTWYNIDDVTGESLGTSRSAANSNSTSAYQEYSANYNLRTPFKFSGGLAVFIQQFGFITGDVEYVNYKTTHFSSNDYDVSNDNADIKDFYRSAVNAHVGAEARLTPAFYLRGGYGIQGSPQKNLETSFKTASGGLGYRFGTYYIDLTYTRTNGTIYTQPYLLSGDYLDTSVAGQNPINTQRNISNPYADLKRVYNNAFLTLGARF